MKAIILARVSTKRQELEGLSLEDIQLPRMRELLRVIIPKRRIGILAI